VAGYTREMAIEEDGIVEVEKWEAKSHAEALKTYEGIPDDQVKHCTSCGQLMPYKSMAYDEGYHFDSCY
jgi:hypothetical protein